MPGIEVRDLVKTYRIAERGAGLSGSVRGLFKRQYKEVRALDGISLSIAPGELVGYIGPNGAGKSTTVKVLSGILVPDSGTCLVNGRVPWENRKEHVARIGTVFGQKSQLWWDLPVKESFDLLKEIYRVPDRDYRESLGELTELFELAELYKTPVRQLSLGQRMRCDMAAALLHGPDTLFLDEPTIGLDAVAKLTLRELIRKINEEKGVTVILTTHDMDDVEALCHRVLLIGHGRILRDGTVKDLRQAYEDGAGVELEEVIRRLYREEALR
ncbi:MAG: ATP-binding cassette domain-containing protein [Spirochaetales bacterium]|nr:ATP-binding cassette domain-containing protein [Spirochaetales bacterium]